MITQISLLDAQSTWNRAYHVNSIHAPFLSYPWHNLWYKTLGSDVESFILSINDTHIAPFVRRGTTIYFSGGEEIADYLDIVGPNDSKQTAWHEIVKFIKNQGVHHIQLRNIPHDSETISFFRKHERSIIDKEDTTPIVALPSTWDSYKALLTKKYRHELERKIRKFEREHPQAIYEESTNPAADIDTFILLMEKDHHKQKFLTDSMKKFFRLMTQEFSRDISLLLLKFNDAPAAATLSFKTQKNYLLYNSGFDKECCQNAGFYLKAMSIKLAIEQGFTEYNFLQGTERYKYELGGVDFGVYSISMKIV